MTLCASPGKAQMRTAKAPRLLLFSAPSGELKTFAEHATAVVSAFPNLAVALLLRHPGATLAQLKTAAGPLQQLGAPLLLHASLLGPDATDTDFERFLDFAQELDVGLHLPDRAQRERSVAEHLAHARRCLGEEALIGVSRHDAAGLGRSRGATYATLSPFGAVPGKGDALGPKAFQDIATSSPVPVIALGGIGPRNADRALQAGASGVAVLRPANDATALSTLLELCAFLDIEGP